MSENQNEHPGERVAKVIARAGLCSRRDAELWIQAGRVSVNGKVLDSPAINVTDSDAIMVDGAALGRRERTRLFFFHKPRGTVTTSSDPEGRTTVFDVLPAGLPRVVSIGRLDINTEGLLLLTNDGGLARALELPSTGWLRRYRVRAHGRTDQAKLDELAGGITIEGVHYRGIEARLDREQGANVWLTIGLREGKNREVRKVMEHVGLDVNRLIRVSYGPFQLGELEEGAVEEVKTRILKDQLGDKIAELANADFDAPLAEDIERAARRVAEEPPRRGNNARSRDDDARTRRPAVPEDESRESPKPGKRRHITALRESAKTSEGRRKERRRIERAETADRKGRSVAVERVVAPPRGRTDSDNSDRRDNGDRPLRRPSRNARNFAALANGDSLERPDRGAARKSSPGSERTPMRKFSRSDRTDGAEKPKPQWNRKDSDARPRRNGAGASADADGRRSKFQRPDRDFPDKRNSRPRNDEPVIPDRIPWGAPQQDENAGARGETTRFNKPDRTSNTRAGERSDKFRPRSQSRGAPERKDGGRPFDRNDGSDDRPTSRGRPSAPGSRGPGSSRGPGNAGRGAGYSAGRDAPGRGGPNREGPSRDGPRRDGPRQDGPSRGAPGRDGPSRSGPSRDGPSRGGPSRSGPSRSGPSRSGPSRGGAGGPGRNGPNRGGPNRGPKPSGRGKR